MNLQTTQPYRPSLFEAAVEAVKSTDTHWTSHLSSAGMTRISRRVVTRLYVADDPFLALDLVYAADAR
jgi:hypothetical protein